MAHVAAKSDVQKQSEASVDVFRRDLGPFVVAAQKTRMPMVFTDEEPGHPVIFANDAFLALTGYAREEVLAKSFQSLLAVGVEAETIPIVEAAFRGECEREPEIHYKRKDGSELATNAVKYGAFSNDAGTIAIDWTVVPNPAGDRLVLQPPPTRSVAPPDANKVVSGRRSSHRPTCC